MAKDNVKAAPAKGEDAAEKEMEFKVPKDATIDEEVTVISLDADPYHDTGFEFGAGKKTADILVKRGWVKLKETKENKEK